MKGPPAAAAPRVPKGPKRLCLGGHPQLHAVTSDMISSQAQLPRGLGGCGLRNSVRISPSAYWAGRADCLPSLAQRFPTVGAKMALQPSMMELQAAAGEGRQSKEEEEKEEDE